MSHPIDTSGGPEPMPAAPDNLAAFVTGLLAENLHPEPQAWLRFLQSGVDTLSDPHYQRFAINRAWRVIFAKLNQRERIDTIDVRYCLVDKEGSIQDWKKLFETGVLPFILEHQLPGSL
ncbi:hypothetical protein HDG34_003219 [Paraburkholderia sp. HC6.4b]|uniref:hypothetical protein n=1 Tax=unclassified Paraburkholderia TaxID=2615204 RepID=UPI0016212FBB|nr:MULTISPECIES: hypothetical protein [unclassified Paraburkholderia]MBB5409278.1 hypothetical protein [Paraburkholderia sp. HC6.4b]MBB5451006.1 hypothetical protein [Paraburkholderia sp. Kb1A]